MREFQTKYSSYRIAYEISEILDLLQDFKKSHVQLDDVGQQVSKYFHEMDENAEDEDYIDPLTRYYLSLSFHRIKNPKKKNPKSAIIEPCQKMHILTLQTIAEDSKVKTELETDVDG